MTLDEELAFEAVMVARGFRVIGALSPDADTCTDAELDLLFPVDVTGVLRDILRLGYDAAKAKKADHDTR